MSTLTARALTVAIFLGVVGGPVVARADGIGIGMFVGEPTGVTIKVDLQRRTALDLVLGVTTYRDGRDGYAHVTYQVSPFAARGRSVVVPFRLGIGAAVYGGNGHFGDEVNVAVRAPFGLALQFRRTPMELYGEVALRLVVLDDNDNEDGLDVDGGLGFRIYF